MWAEASHWGRWERMTEPATATMSRIPATQVSTLRDWGARCLRRALATALRLCFSSWRGTTGKVPVGGPVASWYP